MTRRRWRRRNGHHRLARVFADGHVAFITEAIAPTALVAISTKAGGERNPGDL